MSEKYGKKEEWDQEMVEIDFQDAAGTAVSRPSRAVLQRRGGMIFPVGIFLLLLLVESIIAAGASAAYFFYAGRSGITAIESYTRSYSLPLAEAFGAMTEMCYRTKNYRRLRALFREKIEQNMIGEAFVVLNNGKLIAHSDPYIAKKLRGNLAGDEFAYNLDLILRPAKRTSKDVLFADYNIPSMRVPYKRDVRAALKKYFYAGIDTTGWLVSRAVFGKKKPVGVVAFIVSKERVFAFLSDHMRRSLRILHISLAVATAVSLMVSLVVFLRYRSIQRRAYGLPAFGGAGQEEGPIVIRIPDDEAPAMTAFAPAGASSQRTIKDAIPEEEKE